MIASLNVLREKHPLLPYASACRLDVFSNALAIEAHIQNGIYTGSE